MPHFDLQDVVNAYSKAYSIYWMILPASEQKEGDVVWNENKQYLIQIRGIYPRNGYNILKDSAIIDEEEEIYEIDINDKLLKKTTEKIIPKKTPNRLPNVFEYVDKYGIRNDGDRVIQSYFSDKKLKTLKIGDIIQSTDNCRGTYVISSESPVQVKNIPMSEKSLGFITPELFDYFTPHFKLQDVINAYAEATCVSLMILPESEQRTGDVVWADDPNGNNRFATQIRGLKRKNGFDLNKSIILRYDDKVGNVDQFKKLLK
jgi:hypothetical protein